MIKSRTIKRQTSYLGLMLLVMQVAFTSLICATSSYAASNNALTICTPMGLKTILLDENGEPVEQHDQGAYAHGCFHCATGCYGGTALLAPAFTLDIGKFTAVQLASKHQTLQQTFASTANLSRAPPLNA